MKYKAEKRIASIHGNFLASLAFILFAWKNVAFYTKLDFSSFPHHTLFVFWVIFCFLSESIDCERKSLDFECRTWNWDKCGAIHIYIHFYNFTGVQASGVIIDRLVFTYIHSCSRPKISNEAGLGHRQSTLVTYATWISLLRRL